MNSIESQYTRLISVQPSADGPPQGIGDSRALVLDTRLLRQALETRPHRFHRDLTGHWHSSDFPDLSPCAALDRRIGPSYSGPLMLAHLAFQAVPVRLLSGNSEMTTLK